MSELTELGAIEYKSELDLAIKNVSVGPKFYAPKVQFY
jgi:hypothetical protein